MRALQPFLADNALKGLATDQRGFFYTVDVLLTGLLLSGGADGVHSIVNAVTLSSMQRQPRRPTPLHRRCNIKSRVIRPRLFRRASTSMVCHSPHLNDREHDAKGQRGGSERQD